MTLVRLSIDIRHAHLTNVLRGVRDRITGRPLNQARKYRGWVRAEGSGRVCTHLCREVEMLLAERCILVFITMSRLVYVSRLRRAETSLTIRSLLSAKTFAEGRQR